MYQEGRVIYFTPFYFQNGQSAPKEKYFVVLKVVNGSTILASLPTRNDYIPIGSTVTSGCVELPNISLNCFIIQKDTPITDKGLEFEFTTHLYGGELEDYELSMLQSIYNMEDFDYIDCGMLDASIFQSMINCFQNSDSVKRKYIRLL